MLLLALSLLAATGQTAVEAPKTATKSADDEKIVCRRIVRTGSRLAQKRVCMMAYDWRLIETRAQREVTDLRTRSQVETGPVF